MNGYRVLLLDTKRSNPNHYICLALAIALRQSQQVELLVKAEMEDAIHLARANRCNLFFAFDGEELDRFICSRLAAVCGRSVLWVTEDPYEIAVNVANAALFDLVFTNDSASVPAYGDKGRHLPLAGAFEFHHREVRGVQDALRYDVFFAGTAWPNRVELVRELLEGTEASALRAKIALPTNPHLPKFELPVPLSQIDWRTSPVDFARLANMSVATLVLPRVFSSSGDKDFAETPPPRLFEAALAGTVQLVHSKIAEAARYFVPGEDFLYFDSAAELKSQLARLQAQPALRHEMAVRAQQRGMLLHRYENRVAAVFTELQSRFPHALSAVQAQGGDTSAASRLPRLLMVVHNVAGRGNFGGVEVYLRELARALQDRYEPLFWLPNAEGAPPAALLTDAAANVLASFEFSNELSPWLLSCPERESAFARVLVDQRIDLVHFQHLLKHVPSLVEVARAMGIPAALTFHDYYAVCHNFTLVSFKGTYCAPDRIAPENCDVCLWNGHHALPGSQSARRAYWDRMLGLVDALVFNTQGAFELTARIFPAVASHRSVHIAPVPIPDASAAARIACVDDGIFRIALIGNFAGHKGSDLLTRVMPLFENAGVEFHVFGRIEPRHAWMLDAQRYPYVKVHGSYAPGEIPPAVRHCQVSLHLSIWPETYCLTLSEAWDLGLVPVVTDTGALAERVAHEVNGLKIRVDSEGDLAQAIRRLKETPGLLQRLRQGAHDAPISRMSTHVEQMQSLYAGLRPSFGNIHQTTAMHEALAAGYRPPMKPLLRPGWAIVALPAASSGREAAVGMVRRLRGLAGRGLRHMRRHGVFSALYITARYVRSRM